MKFVKSVRPISLLGTNRKLTPYTMTSRLQQQVNIELTNHQTKVDTQESQVAASGILPQ